MHGGGTNQTSEETIKVQPPDGSLLRAVNTSSIQQVTIPATVPEGRNFLIGQGDTNTHIIAQQARTINHDSGQQLDPALLVLDNSSK